VVNFSLDKYIVRQATQAAFRVEGTNWRLVNFCQSSGCEPNQSSSTSEYLRDQQVLLWFTQAGESGGMGSSTTAGNTYYGGMSGTYTYIEPNRILVNVESNEGGGGQINMGGSWLIEKEGDRLRLVGDYATYDFMPEGTFPTPVPSPTVGPTAIPTQVPLPDLAGIEGLVGVWLHRNGGITIEFTQDGHWRIQATTGELIAEGSYSRVDEQLIRLTHTTGDISEFQVSALTADQLYLTANGTVETYTRQR
jgi:hypothetical protein